jgi:hypothetical protein
MSVPIVPPPWDDVFAAVTRTAENLGVSVKIGEVLAAMVLVKALTC